MNLQEKPGGIARALRVTVQHSSQGSKTAILQGGRKRTPCAQTLTARPPWHDGLTSKPAPTHPLPLASEARSAAGAKASVIGARMGRDARLDAQHESTVRHRRRRTELQKLITVSDGTRRSAKSAVRLYDDPQKHKTTESALRRCGAIDGTRTARSTQRPLPGLREVGAEHGKAPRRSGAPRADAQSPLLRDQIRLCAPSSPSTRRA